MTGENYEFRVAGHLSEATQAAFADMSVRDVPPETVIFGPVIDESHMHGVLSLIQSLGLQVVSVRKLAE